MKPVLSGSRSLLGAIAVAAALVCGTAHAAIWSSTNIQYLKGHSYKLGDESRSIITMEHADGWKYGDNFFFVDVTNPDSDSTTTPTSFYGEYSP
ncbi:MAG TPA: hypothetical protein VFM46_14995, partial [Pseudomonadales bacterium]|nr:hypothetical protein [Pseudomonadales bacterium]